MSDRAWKDLNTKEKNERIENIGKLWRVHGLDPKSIAESLDISRSEVHNLIVKYVMTDEEAEELIKEYLEENEL